MDVVELLRFLIRRMHEELESGSARVQPPALLRLDGADVACAVDGIDLHAKRLEGHPFEALAGFTAPPEWFAVGVLTGGWATEVGVGRYRVRVISFMCRDGSELAASHREGEDLRFLEGRSDGLVADTLRRVLELPTAPPAGDMAEWLAGCWLELLARGKRRKLRWREAAALHPALGVVGARPDELAAVAPRTVACMRWERMRRAYAQEGDPLAAWMDDGMFSRWMLDAQPPVSVALERAANRLTPDAKAKVEDALLAWGLLDQASVA